MTICRYLRTVWYLKPVQVYGRIWRRIYRPKPDLSPLLPDADLLKTARERWKPHPLRPKLDAIWPEFSYFGVACAVDVTQPWRGAEATLLWDYHLHYHEELTTEAYPAEAAQQLVESWLHANPPVQGVGWWPYPTSRRMVHWVKAFLGGMEMPPEAWQSLAIQARHLRRNLETHIRGNHLWMNAKALLMVASLFNGSEAASWRRQAERLLLAELAEQFAKDGSHYEQSPMYHALMLEDVLDLINLAQALGLADVEAALRPVAAAALGFLQACLHPDGQIALFNDAAFDMALHPSQLRAYAESLGLETVDKGQITGNTRTYAESGLVVMRQGAWHLLWDTGPVCCDYLPAHIHADNLTLEISAHGERLLVDSGTGEYGDGPNRQYQRSTAAHNTVQVDGQDSSEVWGAFRCGRRAYPLGQVKPLASGAWRAGHDGYSHLPSPVIHWRDVAVSEDGITITDLMDGQGEHELALFWHLDAAVEAYPPIKRGDSWEITLKLGSFSYQMLLSGMDGLAVENSTIHQHFGQPKASHRLKATAKTTLPRSMVTSLRLKK